MAPAIWIWLALYFGYGSTDAFVQHALLATPEGVMFLNSSSGLTESVIPMQFGAGGVDFHVRRREVYAIMHTNRGDTNYILRVGEIGNASVATPDWCTRDTGCRSFRLKSKYKAVTLVLKPSCPTRPKNLVVDWVQDKIYWTCTEGGELGTEIMGASITDGREVSKVNVSGSVQSLSVDPFKKKLFWTDGSAVASYSLEENSFSANLYQLHFKEGAKMTIDVKKQIIYVAGDHQLFEIDYNLSQKREIVTRCPSFTFSSMNPGPKVMDGQIYQVAKKSEFKSCQVNHSFPPIQPLYTDLTVTDWILHVPCWQEDDCSTECQRPWSQWIMSSAKCNVAPNPVSPKHSSSAAINVPSTQVTDQSSNQEKTYKPEGTKITKMKEESSNIGTKGEPTNNTNSLKDLVPMEDQIATTDSTPSTKDLVPEDIQTADAGGSSLSAVYVVGITIWVGIVVIIILVKKRRNNGSYETGARMDA